ncbi:3-hydroxyisobutyrate dehydrogenase-like beta-hydroxyacid dehydrogenase [Blastococcus colisei]|uniref:3-hydroxyisobutyrate dehydrogenase-like beta-hydroxyacid dehydrogenase n=1 Tax=Blastococcus colisei TaxID=1564162 RepID=A0A543P9W7_9ACTN|nr:NAD(P)-dependent oxidoreductase [Blastococcus colisei]TQN40881.1 3-hydroxyisobutyrate dehydrogenase-like beta-hydroxyacid dehydrogenase [Blastococcus colisei]
MRQVGVVGLGGMGIALTESLLDAGWPVRCHDIRPEPVAAMVARGAGAATSPRALAEVSDVVLTFLPGPEQVRKVALDPDTGVLVGLGAGRAMLDMSTCGPDLAAVLGAAFETAGRRFVDCPVSRKAPNMTVLVGGHAGVLGEDEEVLAAVSRVIVHCGRRGAGYAVKLLNQQVKYGWYLASAEALLVGAALGLDPATVTTAIEESSGSDSGFSTAAKYFLGDAEGITTHAPASTIEKDLALAEAMASDAGVRSRLLAAAVDFFVTAGGTPYRGRPYPESSALLHALRAMPPRTGE